jgi:hypothetical protein
MYVVFVEYVPTTGRITTIHRTAPTPESGIVFAAHTSVGYREDYYFADKHVCTESGNILVYSSEELESLSVDLQLVNEADEYVISEFQNYEIQVNKHNRNSPSKIGTLQQWYDYGLALEDYVQVVDNVRTIMTARPTRPTGA